MTVDSVSIGLAFVAGVASFVSPCVLALLPVYLAFLGEAAAQPAPAGEAGASAMPARTGSVIAAALLFVAGFTSVFVLLGTSFGLLGGPLFRIDEVRQAAGIVIIAIGVLATGVFGPVLGRWQLGLDAGWLPAARSVRALTLGAMVAVGWTPCIGPVLAAILTMGASSGSAPVAALLLLAYSAGVALPFLLAALALPRLRPVLAVLRRHHRFVEVVAGLLIVLVGVLVFANGFGRLASLFTFAI